MPIEYTETELYDLWRNFRGQHDEIRILEDFSSLDRNQAIELSQAFWKRWTRENAPGSPCNRSDADKANDTSKTAKRGRATVSKRRF